MHDWLAHKEGGLFRLRFILLLGFFVLVTLVLLFQKDDRIEALFEQMGADYLSVLYLKVMVSLSPDNAKLRLLLARQLANTGEPEEAKTYLQTLSKQQGETALQARILTVQVDRSVYFSNQQTAIPRKQALSLLQAQLSLLAKEPLPAGLIPAVIDLGLSLERPDIAAMLYERLAESDQSNRYEWLKQAGRWHIASGHPLRAGRLFDKNFFSCNDPAQAVDYALQAIQAMRAADKSELALKSVRRYLERFPVHRKLLDNAVALALETNHVKQAVAWGGVRLAQDPENTALINRQIDLFLAADDLSAGLALARRLIELEPDSSAGRKRLMQIAEWHNQPRLVLEQAEWLARNAQDGLALEKSLQLASGLSDNQALIDMLVLKSGQKALMPNELGKLSEAYVKTGKMGRAIDFFHQYLLRYPDDHVGWENLAAAQTRKGQYREALATCRHILKEFGFSLRPIIKQADILQRMNRSGRAVSLLSAYQDKATVNDLDYWESLAGIAWSAGNIDKAIMAYGHAWNNLNASTVTAERLIQLHREQNPQTALSIAQQAYRRFDQPRWLLLAMDVSIQAGYWEELDRLLQISIAMPARFIHLEMYWLIKAQHASHHRRYNAVKNYYSRALQINPDSDTARSGLLWALIEQNDGTMLARYIQRWRKDALNNSRLQGVYAAALEKMGRYDDALVWMAKKARSSPDDYLWQLGYSDLLGKAGRVDSAIRLRKRVFVELEKKFAQLKSERGSRVEHSLLSEYLRLMRAIKGAPEEFRTLKNTLARGMHDAKVRELLVASYLSQENYAAARFQLLKMYASHQQAPPWQQIAIALKTDNQNELERLLAEYDNELAPQDRIEALKRLGRTDEALHEIDKLVQAN